MRSTSTTLRIAQPCHESWAAMTPTALGHHCAACQKTVVDFTHKTDAEILAYLAQAGRGNTCGRFQGSQLGRPLIPANTPNRWRSWLSAALALGGVVGGERVAAQARSNYFGPLPAPATVQPTSPVVAGNAHNAEQRATLPAPEASHPLLAQGIIVDATTGEPLPGVTVQLQGTARGMSTGPDGKFALPLTEQDAAGTLLISYIGYTTQHLAVATCDAAPAVVKLTADVMGMGEVVIVGGYSTRRPWPWHPRALYNWGKYWVTKPFRN